MSVHPEPPYHLPAHYTSLSFKNLLLQQQKDAIFRDLLLRETTGISVLDIIASCFIAVSSQVCLHANHLSYMTNKHQLQENNSRKRYPIMHLQRVSV